MAESVDSSGKIEGVEEDESDGDNNSAKIKLSKLLYSELPLRMRAYRDL